MNTDHQQIVGKLKKSVAPVTGKLIGLSRDELINARSLVFVDGHPLRTYRHSPNTGSPGG